MAFTKAATAAMNLSQALRLVRQNLSGKGPVMSIGEPLERVVAARSSHARRH